VKIGIHGVECLDEGFKPDDVSRQVAAHHEVQMNHSCTIVFQYFLRAQTDYIQRRRNGKHVTFAEAKILKWTYFLTQTPTLSQRFLELLPVFSSNHNRNSNQMRAIQDIGTGYVQGCWSWCTVLKHRHDIN